jgi:hypothetical protein
MKRQVPGLKRHAQSLKRQVRGFGRHAPGIKKMADFDGESELRTTASGGIRPIERFSIHAAALARRLRVSLGVETV